MNRFQRAWQALTDGAVRAADQQLGIAAPETSVGQAGSPSLEGRPTAGQVMKPTERGPSVDTGLLAPQRPVTPLPPAGPSTIEAIDEQGRVQIYGIPATAFPGGFIVSHGEFDQKMYGWRGVKVYEQMRRTSAQVDATLESVIQPIISANWDIVAAEEEEQQTEGDTHPVSSTGAGKATETKKKQIALAAKENLLHNLEWQDARGNWHSQDFKTEVLRTALLEIATGCSAFEEVYAVDGGALRLARLVDLPPVTFYQWDTDQDGRTLRNLIQYGWRRNRYERVDVPAEKICTFTYRMEGADFWGRPMTRSAYEHWYIVEGLYRIDAIAGERNGMGIPCVTSGPNPSAEDKAAAREFVTALAAHEKTGMVLPNGWTFELVGVKGTTHDLYESINHHNQQISRCALNTFMDMGRGGRSGSSGNRSLGESAQQFFWLCLQNEADSIASRISNKTLRRWTYYNYGPGAPVPQLRAANVVARSFEKVSAMLSQLAAGGLVVSDQDMRDEIRTQLGMPQESRVGLVAVKGETIDLGSGVEISGRSPGQIDTGPGSQGQQQNGSQESGARSQNKPAAPAEPQKPQPVPGVKPGRPIQASDGARFAGRLRATVSPYWHQPVAETETHVDWGAHHRNMTTGEAAVREALETAKIGVIQRVAGQFSKQLAEGKKPSEIVLPHDEELQAAVEGSLRPVYSSARRHVQSEVKRLRAKRPGSPYVAAVVPALLAEIPAVTPEPLRLSAEATVQKIQGRYAQSATNQAADLGGKIPSQEKMAANLNGLSDGFLDDFAGQAARQAAHAGRWDEFKEIDDELQGKEGHYERSELLDQNTCGTCLGGDGKTWDSLHEVDWKPGDDCKGGDNCRGTLVAVF